MSSEPPKPPLMRSLGAFVGHVWKGIRTDPGATPDSTRHEVARHTEEVQDGPVTYRRTTIDEVEIRQEPPAPS